MPMYITNWHNYRKHLMKLTDLYWLICVSQTHCYHCHYGQISRNSMRPARNYPTIPYFTEESKINQRNDIIIVYFSHELELYCILTSCNTKIIHLHHESNNSCWVFWGTLKPWGAFLPSSNLGLCCTIAAKICTKVSKCTLQDCTWFYHYFT